MPEYEMKQELAALRRSFASIAAVLEPEALSKEAQELQAQASDPNLWDDQAKAQRVTGQLSRVKAKLEKINSLASAIDDVDVLIEMLAEAGDSSLESEVQTEINKLRAALDALEIEALLNGEYDSRGAVVTIRSGAGGDDATDFAEMLMRMYLRFAEKQGIKAQVLDISYAEGAGIKSATFELDAPYTYGNISVESGCRRTK